MYIDEITRSKIGGARYRLKGCAGREQCQGHAKTNHAAVWSFRIAWQFQQAVV